jgi:hypothetical protein
MQISASQADGSVFADDFFEVGHHSFIAESCLDRLGADEKSTI